MNATIPQKIALFLLLIFGKCSYVIAQIPDTWQVVPAPTFQMPDLRTGSVCFNIGSKCYMGLGKDHDDFWEFDPSSGIWIKKANFPGGNRNYAIGFSIGNKAYVGTGENNTVSYNDFWEYDPSTNSWNQKANFPGAARSSAIGFELDGNGYVGTGTKNTETGISSWQNYKDFYEFNPGTNSWIRKSDTPFGIYGAVGIGWNHRGYYYGGSTGTSYQSYGSFSFYSYDAQTDHWYCQNIFGGYPKIYGFIFKDGNSLYFGGGYSNIPPNNHDYNRSIIRYDGNSYYSNSLDTIITNPIYFSYGGKSFIGTGGSFFEIDLASLSIKNSMQFNWYGIHKGGEFAIALNGKGYIYNGGITEVDLQNNEWKNYAVPILLRDRSSSTGFTINNKLYLGTGWSNSQGHSLKDFWEFDQTNSQWNKKADFPGPERSEAVAFTIGANGYLGLGRKSQNGNSIVYNDFWRYDASSNSWTSIAPFPGVGRSGAIAFSINGKGYVGTGEDGAGNFFNDLWCYDPSTNTWSSKASFPGFPRSEAIAFTIENKGYLGTGKSNTNLYDDFWEYNPALNLWTQRADFTGGKRFSCQGFASGNFGYIGLGESNSSNLDWRAYSPLPYIIHLDALPFSSLCAGTSTFSVTYSINQTFDPQNVFTVQLSDSTGSFSNPIDLGTATGMISLSGNIPSGNHYRIRISSSSPHLFSNDNGNDISIFNPTASVTPSGPLSICNSAETIPLIGSNGMSYIWSDGEITKDIVVHSPGSYFVTLTDQHGCTAISNTVLVNRIVNSSRQYFSWQKCLGGTSIDKATSVVQCSGGGVITAGYEYSTGGNVTGHHATPLTSDVWLIKTNSAGTLQWQKTFGGTANDVASSVIETSDHGFIIAGSTRSDNFDVTLNKGGSDAWIIKTDSSGNLLWQKTFGGTSDDEANAIIQTPDGGFMVAGTTLSNDGDITFTHDVNASYGDCWLLKLDASGNLQWQKTYGGSNAEFARSILQTHDGGYLLGGSSKSNDGDVSGNHINSQSTSDFWVVKTSANGAIQWQHCYGGTQDDILTSTLQTANGDLFIIGYGNSNDGNFLQGHGGIDSWVIKTNSQGVTQWIAPYGGTLSDYITSGTILFDGGIFLAGYSTSNSSALSGNHGGADSWLARLDSNGFLLWQSLFGGSDTEQTNAICIAPDGGCILAGSTLSNDGDVSGNHGNADFWLLKTNVHPPVITVAGSARSCEGQVNLNVYASWATSYLWSDGESSQTIFPSTTGNYSATAYYERCPQFTTTAVHVTIDKNPSAYNFSGPSQYCPDTTTNLTFFLSGSQPGITYYLNRNGTTITSTQGTGVILSFAVPALTGNYYVTARNDSTSCTTEMNDTINVSTSPYIILYPDNDGDGFGSSISSITSCHPQQGYVANNIDCNDSDPLSYPLTYYADLDGDNYGNAMLSVQSCTQPTGYVLLSGDCNDLNAQIYPGESEICNGLDDDCNGMIDDGIVITTYYFDNDGDNWGSFPTIQTCTPPPGYTPYGGDCDDNNPNVYPGNTEICGNGIDDNCNGLFDEGCYATLQLKFFIQGFYLGNGMMRAVIDPLNNPTDCDEVFIGLSKAASPQNQEFFCSASLKTNGTCMIQIPYSFIGNSYYVVIRHRNALETWSSIPVSISQSTDYDFTITRSSAFGNNECDLNDGHYALWSGDVIDADSHTPGLQDGIIDTSDFSEIENSTRNVASGFLPEDLTGDHIVESSDYSLIENNLPMQLFVIRP